LKFRLLFGLLCVILISAVGDSTNARERFDYGEIRPGVGKATVGEPFVDIGIHDVGRMGLTVVNQGQFGTGFVTGAGGAPSCVYPYPSSRNYLYAAAFWIGAVVGRDTLVSVGADGWNFTREFWPESGSDPYPYGGAIQFHSISNAADKDAVSEQDYIAVYTDTLTDPAYVGNDPTSGRPHIPLNIEVIQRSYSWSYSYAEDFVLFDFSIKNIGRRSLDSTYMGVYVDGDVLQSNATTGFADDICGFRVDFPTTDRYGCNWLDTINIAWIADGNGRNDDGSAPPTDCQYPAATGTRVVRTPSDSLKYSFNWWVSNGDPSLDWGPRRIGTPDDPFRDFGGFLGTPEGDHNKYYIMRHEEFDYDQLFSATDQTANGWLPPDSRGANFANGFDTRYLLSFGPFDIDPGEVLPISLCYVAGDDFHVNDCNNFDNLFSAYSPQMFYDSLNFEDLALNSKWASWIYDNPGVDTDGDGYAGKFRVCVYDSNFVDDTLTPEPNDSIWVIMADTSYYEGDDVPDFLGASPPPPPEVWIIDTLGDTLGTKIRTRVSGETSGELVIRWNGLYSETTEDVFSKLADFEGYRVYMSYSPNPDGFSLLASYDRENYNRWTFNTSQLDYELLETPFLLDSLQAIYGEGWNPDDYDRDHPFVWNDTAYYFAPQDANQSYLRDTMQIHKIYPDEPPPSTLNLDSARILYPEELTDDGLFFKYYEYEYIVRNILPAQLHYVSVTAFDYGSPKTGLKSLETPKDRNFVADYVFAPADTVEQYGLKVIAYPNPYRADGNYQEHGFEGRDYTIYNNYTDSLVAQELLNEDRTRSIHFINLPHKCTIRIYTIDGDLVREIEHDAAPGSPQSSHERWDMITRNTQSVVSGIYYYSVESEFGSQIGKLVIIM
jgi:hypothetical protein